MLGVAASSIMFMSHLLRFRIHLLGKAGKMLSRAELCSKNLISAPDVMKKRYGTLLVCEMKRMNSVLLGNRLHYADFNSPLPHPIEMYTERELYSQVT